MGLKAQMWVLGRTDRQADGRLTVALPRSALASRGKNTRLVSYRRQLASYRRQWAPNYHLKYKSVSTLSFKFQVGPHTII